MTNYPKEWMEELYAWLTDVREAPYDDEGLRKVSADILRALDDIGALKKPPKPREFWVCDSCMEVTTDPTDVCEDGTAIHVKEIL